MYIFPQLFHAEFYFPSEKTATTNVLSSVITMVSSTPDLSITKGQNIFKFNIRQRENVTKYLFHRTKVTANLKYTNNMLELIMYWKLL